MVEMLLAFYINSDPATSIVSGQGNKVARSIVWNSSLKTGDKRQIRTGSVAYPTDTHHCMPLCHESQGGRFTAVEEMLPPPAAGPAWLHRESDTM